MSRKKKRKNRKWTQLQFDKKEKNSKELLEWFHKKEEESIYIGPCHKAHYVKVGPYQVYCCGVDDLTEDARQEIEKLDLFIGLDSRWNDYVPIPSENTFVVSFRKRIGTILANLFVYPIFDYSIDYKIPRLLIQVLKEKWNVGFGCVGGHGRTGWLLGKLIKSIEGLESDDLKKAVQDRLCVHAIEGMKQHEDLGIKYTPVANSMAGWSGQRYARFDQYKSLNDDIPKDNTPKEEKNFSYVECLACNGTGYEKETDLYKMVCRVCDGVGMVLEVEGGVKSI